MTFWERLFLLFGTLWCFIVVFMFYMWKLQQKQQRILRYIAYKLTTLEHLISPRESLKKAPTHPDSVSDPQKPASETIITIDKNEPISKYESVNLPDEININFVDR